MRRTIAILYILFLTALCASGQVFIGTKPTGNPVVLEVKSNSRGVLIPRIDIPDIKKPAPVTKPVTGLLVVNTHAGNEGLFFWGVNGWEKLKTEEAIVEDLKQMGKQTVFIGTEEKTGMTLTSHKYTNIPLKASLGKLTASKTHSTTIPEDGLYEVTASFTGNPSTADGFIVLVIYNYSRGGHIAYTTGSQTTSYRDIAAKAVYYGTLKKGDEIGIRIFYGTNDKNASKVEKLTTAILGIKRIN
jgi:hypothetical protein